jgi:hypothetical protein
MVASGDWSFGKWSPLEIGRSENGRLWRLVVWKMVASGDWPFGEWTVYRFSKLVYEKIQYYLFLEIIIAFMV